MCCIRDSSRSKNYEVRSLLGYCGNSSCKTTYNYAAGIPSILACFFWEGLVVVEESELLSPACEANTSLTDHLCKLA